MKRFLALFIVLMVTSGLSHLCAQVGVTGRIVSNSNINLGIQGVAISFSGTSTYSTTTNSGGQFTFLMLPANQNYSYTVSAEGYTDISGTLQVGNSDIIMGDIILNEIAYPPRSVSASVGPNNSSVITWYPPNPASNGFDDDFEAYDDFSLAFGEWTLRDIDMTETYGYSGTYYPHYQEPMAFMIFNPENTIPPIQSMSAHSGSKFAASFCTMTPPNNDWMITPLLHNAYFLRFWAKSYTSQYGLERFKVGVSTSSTLPQTFNIISGPGYLQAPTDWTEYYFDLSAYAGQDIYVGIQCVSDDAFIFMVDDIITGYNGSPNSGHKQQLSLASEMYSSRSSDRHLQGYKVWRLLNGDQVNEANWTAITPNTITATAFADASWGALPMGIYMYAVKAVYSNNVLSLPAFSNALACGMPGTLQGTITDSDSGLALEGVSIHAGSYSCSSNAQGFYSMDVFAGNHNVYAMKEGYQTYSVDNVLITALGTTTLNISLVSEKLPPSNFSATVQGRNVHLTWLAPSANEAPSRGQRSFNPSQIDTRAVLCGYKIYRDEVLNTQINDPAADSFIDLNLDLGVYQYAITALYDIGESFPVSITVNINDTWVPMLISEGFEGYPDFSLEFDPWILRDLDNSPTGGIDGVQFPNSGSEMAFMIFNPGQTVPPLQDIQAYEGNKMAASFWPPSSATMDWLITPRLQLGENSRIKFQAMTHSSGLNYGCFKLGVCTHPEILIPFFQNISGTVTIPRAWMEYEYDLSAYDNQEVYLGLSILSVNITAVYLDDIRVYSGSVPTFSITPNSHDFGLRYLGTETEQEFTISNIGADGLIINDINLSGNSMFSFVTMPELPLALNAGQSESFSIVFAPTETGSANATISISENINADPHIIEIQGEASDLLPPANLNTQVHGLSVRLSWSAPEIPLENVDSKTSGLSLKTSDRAVLTGFKLYRNGVQIAFINDAEARHYIDAALDPGNYVYALAAMYQSGESLPISSAVSVNPLYGTLAFEDGFEDYVDFSYEFSPWILFDVDQSPTSALEGTSFLGQNQPMSYMIFNPHATVPPITDVSTYAGNKMAACFGALGGSNDDWLISPRLDLEQNNGLRFFAKSYSPQNVAERIRIGVSTLPTANYQDFQIISGAEALEVPADWTEYMFDLSAFQNQQVYFGINSVSSEGLALFIDQVELRVSTENADDNSPVVQDRLISNFPNPFNPETTICYSIKESVPVTIEILNLKGQMVNRLVNSVKSAGEHSVVWNGKDETGKSLSSGVYFYKLQAGAYSETRKMIMLK